MALHEPYEGEEPKTSVIKTWFVTNYEVREKKPIDFKVFMDSGIQPNNRFDISYANTAMVKDKDLVYIDFQLGKLFGRGYLFELSEADELVNASELWIS